MHPTNYSIGSLLQFIMTEQLHLWINGFGFGVFLICGIVMLMVSRTDNAVRRACVIMAINLFYLAFRLPVIALLPPDAAFYVGHAPEVIAMFSMTTAVVVNLLLLQLTHYAQVTWGYAFRHMLVFLQLILLFYIVAWLGNDVLLIYIFRVYMLLMWGYMILYTYYIVRALKRYDKELSNTYVNIEDRSLKWFRNLLIMAVALFLGNVVANILTHSTVPGIFFRFGSTFLWSFFAYKVGTLRESYLSYEADEVCDDVPIESIADEAKADEVNTFVNRLRETLEANGMLYNEDLTRDDVMHAMSITHVTLGRNLHAATGMSFSAFVTDLRLEHIAQQLLATDDNVESIYYSCGFRSRTTFYRAFSKKFQCSPAEYRRNHGK